MKIYLAGPMRGYPELNYPAFHAAASVLRVHGFTVFNPAEYTGPDMRTMLGADLAWITACAEVILVLEGWEKSLGAQAEVATARALGLPVWEIERFLDLGTDASEITH